MEEIEEEEQKPNFILKSMFEWKKPIETTSKTYTSILHINIRTIKKHWLTFLATIEQNLDHIEVIIISETRCTEEEILNFNRNSKCTFIVDQIMEVEEL